MDPYLTITAPPTGSGQTSLFSNLSDSLGRPFDPDKWRSKAGAPQLDSLGRYVPKVSGRSKRSRADPPAAPAPANEESPPIMLSERWQLVPDETFAAVIGPGLSMTVSWHGRLYRIEIRPLDGRRPWWQRLRGLLGRRRAI